VFVQNLAPAIHRQRLVIEGIPNRSITDVDIVEYLKLLTKVLEMTPLMTPVAHRSPTYGWAGWTHWETSGAHFYAWDTPTLFFSVDIYTCKPFHDAEAVAFTKDYFGAETIVHKGF
jgi:S-adenosylmethionine decarboxylase